VSQQDIINGTSKIDSTFKMIIVYPTYAKYDQMESLFKQHGYAFLPADGTKTFYVDGQAIEKLSKDQFYAIQAHEIAHFVLKHKGHYTVDQEREADVAGVVILNKLGYKEAAKVLQQRAVHLYSKGKLTLKADQVKILQAYLA